MLRGKIMAVLVLLALCGQGYAEPYGGGSGTAEAPYLICDANHMQEIGANSGDWSKHFKLMADIDLSDFNGLNGNPSFNIIGPTFTGTFDGNGHEILNFTYSSTGTSEIGLFRSIGGENAKIKDLGLINVDIDAGTEACWYIGALVGKLQSGATITDCYVENGRVLGYGIVGGLVGISHGGTALSNCYSIGSFSGLNNVGGLVGYNHSTVSNCYSVSSVSGKSDLGGLLGGTEEGTISNCFSAGRVFSEGANDDHYVGGLIGFIYDGIVINCYSSSNVVGPNTHGVGGLAGFNNHSGTISKCYSVGRVSGSPGSDGVGGLVGGHGTGPVTYSFWDKETSGQTSSAGGTGKTTAQMLTKSTFTSAGWDFETPIWEMCDEPDYPKLWWEKCPVPPIEVAMQFTPQALNPGSKGNWVKAHFVLPEGFVIDDVDANTPAMIEPLGIESDYINVFINEDGLVEIEAAFSRADFCGAAISDGTIEVTVIGLLSSGQEFYGTDTIRIINNNLQYVGVLASHWLEAGCGRPDWCSGLDFDQDSVVNFVDFALFDGCCIEVIKN